jgi:hypothetical protein
MIQNFFSLFRCRGSLFLNFVHEFQLHPPYGYFKEKEKVLDKSNSLVNTAMKQQIAHTAGNLLTS